MNGHPFTDNVIMIGQKKGKDCAELLKSLTKLCRDGGLHSMAVVLIPKPGEYRVTGAGTDIDGLLEGTIALHDSLITLLQKEQDTKTATAGMN